jgi:hypothetical protein
MEASPAPSVVPEAYANALLLRGRGLSPEAVAQKLDIPPGAIGSFLRVAEAKLDHLLDAQPESNITEDAGGTEMKKTLMQTLSHWLPRAGATNFDQRIPHGIEGRIALRTGSMIRIALALGLLCATLLALAPRAGAYVYWANSGLNGTGTTIGRANLDGTLPNQSFITGAGDPCGIAVDANHIYWSNLAPGTFTISRANLDGTDVDRNFITGVIACGLAVDANHIYWGDIDPGIGRADLDGNPASVEPSYVPPTAGLFWGVAVDGGHVYWADVGDFGSDYIGRYTFGAMSPNNHFITTGAATPRGLAVDAGHIYWANNANGTIGRARLNGTGAADDVHGDFIGGASSPNGVAVDASHVYWANEGLNGSGTTIGRANLDGSSPRQDFIGGASRPAGIAVDSLVPSNAFTIGKLKGKTLTINVSDPGTVTVDGAAAKSLTTTARAAKKRKKHPSLKPSSASGGPPTIKIKLKLSGAAKKTLKRKGKLKLKAKVTFTPTGGTANTKTAKLKLKLRGTKKHGAR